ncbi:interferon-induced, double-stranded RNA-activated protein kinase isoform X2 [Anguilla rostrata]|uniref:interferon-induced, double-stranded RNA-activated protein kinase isoform X2 n=1 Tax=Anguilla rostrata TaxID=7938 RepID=UPI0030CE9A7C
MDVQNYVPRLNELAQKSRLSLRYEDVCADGPDHCRIFTIRVVLDDKVYPAGVGGNKKEAKQNAAKNALQAIHGESDQQDVSMTRAAECPSPRPSFGPITQPNYVCWLNEYAHKMKWTCRPIESTQLGPLNTPQRCRYVVDSREFPEAFGSTKREAKELAAKAVYEELMSELNKEGVDESQPGDATGQATGQDEALSQGLSAVCLNRSYAAETPSMKHETNYIGILNTYCQTTKRVCDYKLVEKKGPAHDPVFVYKVVIDKKEYPESQGKSAKEAKQLASQLAWEALQEQSDWDSQVSGGWTVSEDGTPSPPSSARESEVKTEMNNQAESSSGGIVFQSSSTANRPNMACSSADVRPKRKLAPSFSNALSKESGVKNNNLKKVPEKTTPDSCFLRDYDQIMSIGKGGFGRVFKARKIIEDKNVAVKIVKSTKKALREVNALSDLQHRNIVRYYHAWIEDTRYQQDPSDCSSSTSDSGSTAKYVYIQMELCEGGTLRAWIKERNGNSGQEMRDEKALHILQQVVDGVQYIHSKKLIHRDLKPLNILFASDKTVKIGDFGLVTSAEGDSDEAMLERTKGKGTRSYMSPEQMNQHKYDKEVDIFALGLIYFELLWRMTTYIERSKIWEDVRRRKFPTQFCMKHNTAYKLIERMLSERPEDRPDAREIASELAKYCTSIKEDQNALQELKTV